jgi:ribokinase
MQPAPRVLVVGSVMTDMTVSLDRMPAAGETLVGRSFLLGFGGKGANQATMAALLGAQVSMVACVGADAFGAEAVENLESLGIDTRGVRVLEGTATGVAPIWVEASGENRIVIVPGANTSMSVEQVEEAFAASDPPDVVICQLEIPLPCVRRALELGREHGATTILNPAPYVEEAGRLLELADWVTPNEVEFDVLSRTLPGDGDGDGRSAGTLEQQLLQAGRTLRCSLLMTHGERGALLFSAAAAEVRHVGAPPAEVLDTSGAGDAFVGAFATALARGAEDLTAAEAAVSCASMTVEAPGTQASFAQAAKRMLDSGVGTFWSGQVPASAGGQTGAGR